MVIQAFVSLRLDYCNSLFYGISDRFMRRLQAVQNAAARLVTGTRRRDHISPVLRQLMFTSVVAGPRLWNSLPFNLRQSDLTLHQYGRAL